jgi:putative alpha-1,2-mannosidase
MKIAIQSLKTAAGQDWQVILDRNSVTFHSESEARQFVSTLQRRIKAPHVLPEFRRAAG